MLAVSRDAVGQAVAESGEVGAVFLDHRMILGKRREAADRPALIMLDAPERQAPEPLDGPVGSLAGVRGERDKKVAESSNEAGASGGVAGMGSRSASQ